MRWGSVRIASLESNAVLIFGTQVVNGALGFFFWWLIAAYYNSHDIGIAASIMSAVALISSISMFGLNYSLIHFLPKSPAKLQLIVTSLFVCGVGSAIACGLFMLMMPVLLPTVVRAASLHQIALVLSFLCITWTIFLVLDSAFISLRGARFSFAKNLIYSSSRPFLSLLFIQAGFIGILLASSLSTLVSILFAVAFFSALSLRSVGTPLLDIGVLKPMARYSAGNYVSHVVGSAPMAIVPLVILELLGPSESAYLYMAMFIAGTLQAFAVAFSTSLFVEITHDMNAARVIYKRARNYVVIFSIGAILLTFVCGEFILSLFGDEYAAFGYPTLMVLVLANVPMSFNSFYMIRLRASGEIRPLVSYSCVGAVLLIGLTVVLVTSVGILGVGVAWFVGQTVLLCLFKVFLKRPF